MSLEEHAAKTGNAEAMFRLAGIERIGNKLAAKRWYDKRFFGGAYTMGAPLNAYCNKAHGSQRHWSLRYHAEGPEVDPSTAFFVLWKYDPESAHANKEYQKLDFNTQQGQWD